MPFLVTEFATVAESFAGAPLPDGCSSLHDPAYEDGCEASNSIGYGVRAVENALALANLGVAGSLFWLADDKDGQAWGLVDGTKAGDPKRPAFSALQSLVAPLTSDAGGCEVSTSAPQGGWRVLKPNWDPGQEVRGAGFVSHDGASLVVSLVNSDDVSITQPVAITGGSLKPGHYRGCSYTASGLSTPNITVTRNAFSYTLRHRARRRFASLSAAQRPSCQWRETTGPCTGTGPCTFRITYDTSEAGTTLNAHSETVLTPRMGSAAECAVVAGARRSRSRASSPRGTARRRDRVPRCRIGWRGNGGRCRRR